MVRWETAPWPPGNAGLVHCPSRCTSGEVGRLFGPTGHYVITVKGGRLSSRWRFRPGEDRDSDTAADNRRATAVAQPGSTSAADRRRTVRTRSHAGVIAIAVSESRTTTEEGTLKSASGWFREWMTRMEDRPSGRSPNLIVLMTADGSAGHRHALSHRVDLRHDLFLQPLEVVERLGDRHVGERRPQQRHRQARPPCSA